MDVGIAVSQRASRSLETVGLAIAATTSVADELSVFAQDMRDASQRLTENMASSSVSVKQSASAASEMRSTTSDIVQAMAPVIATAEQNAHTTLEAARTTETLVGRISEISTTVNVLHDWARMLHSSVGQFNLGKPTVQQRKYARAAATFEVKRTVNEKPLADARARDIGGGGICFESSEAVAVNAVIDLRFELPGAGWIEAAGRVVASNFDTAGGQYIQSVAFSRIAEAAREAIVAYVAAQRSGAVQPSALNNKDGIERGPPPANSAVVTVQETSGTIWYGTYRIVLRAEFARCRRRRVGIVPRGRRQLAENLLCCLGQRLRA